MSTPPANDDGIVVHVQRETEWEATPLSTKQRQSADRGKMDKFSSFHDD